MKTFDCCCTWQRKREKCIWANCKTVQMRLEPAPSTWAPRTRRYQWHWTCGTAGWLSGARMGTLGNVSVTAQLFTVLLLITHALMFTKGKRVCVCVCALNPFYLMDGLLLQPFPAYRGSSANKAAIHSKANRMYFLSQTKVINKH